MVSVGHGGGGAVINTYTFFFPQNYTKKHPSSTRIDTLRKEKLVIQSRQRRNRGFLLHQNFWCFCVRIGARGRSNPPKVWLSHPAPCSSLTIREFRTYSKTETPGVRRGRARLPPATRRPHPRAIKHPITPWATPHVLSFPLRLQFRYLILGSRYERVSGLS